MRQCKDCEFFVRLHSLGGRCHRYPPQIYFEIAQHVSVSGQAVCYQPYVENKDWCGEHKELVS